MTRTALLFGALLAACGSSATGATCPTTDPPTYDSFGRQFFATYCTDCHSITATDRHDAPRSQDYDSEADIAANADAIDAVAASGPDATNTSMPELDSFVTANPSKEERARLGQYLACLSAGP